MLTTYPALFQALYVYTVIYIDLTTTMYLSMIGQNLWSWDLHFREGDFHLEVKKETMKAHKNVRAF